MFERRLKIFLGMLLAVTIVLVLRAVQLQVFNRAHWDAEAKESLKKTRPLETTRGSILDARGRVLASDEACIDACVDFRAMSDDPDPRWLTEQALARLRRMPGDEYRRAPADRRRQMLAAEIGEVKADIAGMWQALADETKHKLEDVEAARQAVLRKVRARKRVVWYARYRRALREHEGREPAPWYRGWLLDDSNKAPEVDSFLEKVAEEEDAHVIVSGITNETYIRLQKNIEQYPGLQLRGGKQRLYPFRDAACHVIGHIGKVVREDLANDPNLGVNELREYQYNDVIGRSGLEALLEPTLRGTRGEVTIVAGEGTETSRKEPVPGRNVRSTIDIYLQADIQRLFEVAEISDGPINKTILPMHGAAIVIDVPTGEVRALASYPTYDLNTYDADIARHMADAINAPLLNRATQVRYEPGSTIKPVSGIAAITEGLIKPYEGVECTGFLVVNNKRQSSGRCWVASMYVDELGVEGVKHHQVPHPHVGTHGNPDGFLTFPEALERSCNVFFESQAHCMRSPGDPLGLNTLSKYFALFGLGHETGIGIPERPGILPDSYAGPASWANSVLWFSAIGQTQVLASPIQMANVAATIARDGLWMRPRLVPAGVETRPILVRDPADRKRTIPAPDVIDLKLPREAVAAAREGMVRVVNAEAGTGAKYVRRTDMHVAGKTGTAQAAPIRLAKKDLDGKVLKDEEGKTLFTEVPLARFGGEPTKTPWYRGYGKNGTDLKHAWYIGFAPAERPQIAFAVMVEYGGSGGANAGPIAGKLLDACVRHGYLKPAYETPGAPAVTNANGSAAAETGDVELLRSSAGPD